jgi:hypothetical protein
VASRARLRAEPLRESWASEADKAALDASGRTDVQYPISRDAQHADIRHEPDPTREAERAHLGLLGRIAAVLCLLEVYAHAPGGAELRACVGKHFAHWEECVSHTRAQNKRRKAKGLPPVPLVEPLLWIIAAEVSGPMLRKLKLDRAPGWPAGVYFHGDDLYRIGIIVADELPRDRSTILVRIMAAGKWLTDAIADLATLPEDAIERVVAEDIVVHLQQRLARKPSWTSEEEELIMIMQGNWKQARQIGLDEGRKEGRAEARASDVLTVLRVRSIAVPDAARERIIAEKDAERLERWHERAILAASIEDVFRGPS